MPVAHLTGDLPHWRQKGTTYFVTFRLADSLPQEKLIQWHSEQVRQEFYDKFPARIQYWLDAGYGSCALGIPKIKALVENESVTFTVPGICWVISSWRRITFTPLSHPSPIIA